MSSNESLVEVEISAEDVEKIREQVKGGTNRSYLAKKYNCDIGHIDFIANRDVAKDKAAWDLLNGKS